MRAELIPEDLNFENCRIIGKNRSYEFNRKISEGSQGIIYLFSNKEDNVDVVYKYCPVEKENQSTQIRDRYNNYNTYLNEKDYLSILSLNARMHAYFVNENFIFEDNILYNEYGNLIQPGQFISEASRFNDLETLLKSDFSRFPIIIDQAIYICDMKNEKKYYPIVPDTGIRTYNMESSYGLNYIDYPLYSFEEGKTLDHHIKNGFDGLNRDNIVKQLIRSVGMIHSIGLIHRDLKPENIIINKDGMLKLLDFGIASKFCPSDRVVNIAGMDNSPIPDNRSENLISRRWYGSRIFSDPDMYLNKISNRHDIFSLGLLTHLIEFDEHPYFGKTPFSEYYDKFTKLDKQEYIKSKRIRHMKNKHKKLKLDPNKNKYTTWFDLKKDRRPARMIQILNELGLELPSCPNFYDYTEFTQNPIISKFTQRMYDKIKKTDKIPTGVEFIQFENNFLD